MEQRLFDCEKDFRSRTHGWHGRPRCVRGNLGSEMEYHSSSSSSSWSRLRSEFTICEESFRERTRQRSLVYHWLITKITLVARQACCVTQFIRSRTCNGRIIVMSVFNETVWGEKGNEEWCKCNAHEVADHSRRFPRGHWSFLGPGSEKKWCGTYSDKPDGFWDKPTENIMLKFAETIHPLFCTSSALERGRITKQRRGSKKTIHFNGSEQNVELILRTVISANQLSVYGAAAEICTEVSKDTMASGNQNHMQHKILWKRWKFLPNLLLPTLEPVNSDGETWCKIWAKNRTTIWRPEVIQTMLRRWFENLRSLMTIREFERDWIRKNTKIGPVLNVYVCRHEDRYSIEIQVRSLFQDRTDSWVRIVNGIGKYVNETTETMDDEEHEALEKLIAKARPRMKSTMMLTPCSVPPRERKWVDVDPGSFDHEYYDKSKAMTTLPRHDQNDQEIHRETDGAITYEDIVEEFNNKKKKFEGASQWSLNDWILFWHKEEEPRKGFNIVWIPSLPDTFCISEQSRCILEVLLLISSCKTMNCNRKDLPSTSTTSGMKVKCIQQTAVD